MMHRMSLIAVTTLLLAACGGGAVGVGDPVTTSAQSPTDTPSDADAPSGSDSAAPGDGGSATTTTAPADQAQLVAYYLMPGGETAGRAGPFLVPVARSVPSTQAVGRAALAELLEGPTPDEAADGMSTAIPPDTLLLDLAVSDGVATVDLSGSFDAGGGSFAQTARLAQVVYTLTQFPTVNEVVFRLDGEPVSVFGSEGIVLDGPVGRDDYLDLVPTIMVESPPYGGTVGERVRIAGTAAVFEATFHLEVLGADGEVLARPAYAMTDNGTGWGSFDVTVEVDVSGPEWGTLRVWNYSARDGSEEAVREYPIYIDPSA